MISSEEDSVEEYMEFNTMEQAQERYNKLDGKAEIQMYDREHGCYKAVLYPTYEF